MGFLLLALLPFLLVGLGGSDSGSDSDAAPDPDPQTPDPDTPDPQNPAPQNPAPQNPAPQNPDADPLDSASPSNPLDQILRDTDAPSARNAGDGRDLVLGADGGDTLSGDEGRDTLAGEAGADRLSGQAGDDLLLGAWGQDSLFGGSGFDTLSGGSGDDVLAGGAGDDDLFGSSGSDTLVGDDGNDFLIGVEARSDQDTADLIGIDLADLQADLRAIYGTALTTSDQNRVTTGVLNGDPAEGGADLLIGDAGDDLLVADRGDLVTGGEGRDEFGVFYTPGDTAPVEIGDYDPQREALLVIVDGQVDGGLGYRDDAFQDGVEVTLDGRVVAYLEGVRASEIDPNLLRLGVIGA